MIAVAACFSCAESVGGGGGQGGGIVSVNSEDNFRDADDVGDGAGRVPGYVFCEVREGIEGFEDCQRLSEGGSMVIGLSVDRDVVEVIELSELLGIALG